MEKTNLILVAVLVVMVVVAGVQALQFNSMKNKLSSVEIGSIAAPQSSPASTPSSSSGSGSVGVLSSLPTQIGGC